MDKEWMLMEGLEDLIEKNYDIKVYKSEKMHKVLKLHTSDGVKAFKKVYSSYREYSFILEVMDHARENGFSNIPRVSPTKDGKMGIEVRKGVFMVMEWINTRLAQYDIETDLDLMAQALARLHNASEGYEPSPQVDPRVMWGKWLDLSNIRYRELEKMKEVAENKKYLTDFDHLFLTHIDYFYDLGKQAVERMEKCGYEKISLQNQKKKTFAHLDAVDHNILITNKKKVYMIDFDNCMLDMTLHDLTSLLIKSVRYGNWDMKRPRLLFYAYHKTRNVLEEEIALMKAFWEFPQDLWLLAHRYYYENRNWKQQKFDYSLKRIVDDIESREKFIKEF